MKTFSLAFFLLVGTVAFTQENVLYPFQGGKDGVGPIGGLVFDAAGNLYGVTEMGGDDSCDSGDGCGTVFELSPDGKGGWTKTTLHTFTGGSDGQAPLNSLIIDGQGNLYGTTSGPGYGHGCPPSCGNAFELSPATGGWKFALLHNFVGGVNGGEPSSPLIMDRSGNLYGTTYIFGANGIGTMYQLSSKLGGGRTFKTLHSFDVQHDRGTPSGSLVMSQNGTIYGSTWATSNPYYGALYSISLSTKGKWIVTDLHAFATEKDCGDPIWGLSADGAGNLYCSSGPDYGNKWGVLFKFSLNAKGKWVGKSIYAFGRPDGGDPSYPAGTVLVDSAGNIYGTSSFGGSEEGVGTVYELALEHRKYSPTVLYSFQGKDDGEYPSSPLIMDTSGNLYGVASEGGAFGSGVAFEVTH
jgi:uncharacterized repeat protein (TIGR03803 family)